MVSTSGLTRTFGVTHRHCFQCHKDREQETRVWWRFHKNKSIVRGCSRRLVYFTVQNLLILKMSWCEDEDVINSWSSWLWRLNSTPPPSPNPHCVMLDKPSNLDCESTILVCPVDGLPFKIVFRFHVSFLVQKWSMKWQVSLRHKHSTFLSVSFFGSLLTVRKSFCLETVRDKNCMITTVLTVSND